MGYDKANEYLNNCITEERNFYSDLILQNYYTVEEIRNLRKEENKLIKMFEIIRNTLNAMKRKPLSEDEKLKYIKKLDKYIKKGENRKDRVACIYNELIPDFKQIKSYIKDRRLIGQDVECAHRIAENIYNKTCRTFEAVRIVEGIRIFEAVRV